MMPRGLKWFVGVTADGTNRTEAFDDDTAVDEASTAATAVLDLEGAGAAAEAVTDKVLEVICDQ